MHEGRPNSDEVIVKKHPKIKAKQEPPASDSASGSEIEM
jgi:hypothetical protein